MLRWSSIVVVSVLGFGGASALVSGCVTEQERTPYGPPSILGSRKLPDPEGVTTPGTPPPAEDGTAACGTPVEPDPGCTVSWKTDLFPLLRDDPSNGATMKCSNSGACHGEPATQEPVFSNDDASLALKQLAAFTKASLGGTAKPYINVCSKDPEASSINCNLAGACGLAMPQGGVGSIQPSSEFMDKLKTWLACGAPDN